MPTKSTNKPSAKELQKIARGLGIKGYGDMGLKELRAAVEEAQTTKPSKAKSAPANKRGPGRPRKDASVPAKRGPGRPRKTADAPVAKRGPGRPRKDATAPVPAKRKVARRTPGGLGATKDSVRVSYPGTGIKKATDKVNPFRKSANLFHVAPLLFRGGTRQQLATKLSEKIELRPYQKDIEEVDLLDYDKRILLAAQTMREKYGFGVLRTGRGMEGTIKVFVPGSADDPANKNGKVSSKKAAKAAKR